MIHGKGSWRKHFPAVVAPALADLTLPPLRFSQFPGLVSFPIHKSIIYIGSKLIQNVSPRMGEKTEGVSRPAYGAGRKAYAKKPCAGLHKTTGPLNTPQFRWHSSLVYDHTVTKRTWHFKGKGSNRHPLFVLQIQATCSIFSKPS